MVQAGEQLVRVNQDTRLNYRVLDLRTPANQAIFRIQCQVENVCAYLLDHPSSPFYSSTDIFTFELQGAGFLCSALAS